MAQDTNDDRPNPGRPSTPIAVGGLIGERYRQLGGRAWGLPIHTEQTTPDGVGRYVHFKDHPQRQGANMSIYWTPQTGAHEIFGLIRAKWESLNWEHSHLGYPTSGELVTHDGVGRWQTFQGGIIVWHPDTGAHEVHGAILERYGALGGSAWGYPTTDEGDAKGAGRYHHFRDVATGHDKSIYWSPATGAQEIFGYIRRRFEALNWEHSHLGYPTSGELATHDGVGRWQTFQGGIVVWHGDTGAYDVYGPILERYGALGGSAWGYPTAAQGVEKGAGRVQQFVELPARHAKSINWSPDTGPVEVVGYIRRRYERMGRARSALGHPTGPEEPWNEFGQRGRQQRFQHGRILYRARDNATSPDPVRFNKGIRSKFLASFGADVNVELHFDGRVRLHGRVTTDGEGYDWAINAMVRRPDVAVAIRDSGHIPGKVPEIGPRNQRHFSTEDRRPSITQFFFDLQNGKLEVNEEHEGDLTGAVDNVLATILSWGATAALGAGGIFLIYAGAELAGLISTGDFTGGLRIVNGTGFMLGPGGFLLAISDIVASIGANERGLTPAEREIADLVFDGTLDDVDIVLTDSQIFKGSGFAFPGLSGRRVYLNIGESWAKNPVMTPEYRQFLIHELVHAWQFKYMGFLQEYVVDGAFARLQELVEGRHETYDPGMPGKKWNDYRLEQQATLIEEWFADHYRDAAAQDHNLASPAAINDSRFRYVAGNLRTGSA